jgi:hypothetical protein
MDISKYIEWCKNGRRDVDITISKEGITKIWCFDFTIMECLHVKPGEDPPTTKTLKDQKRKRLVEELDNICSQEADND